MEWVRRHLLAQLPTIPLLVGVSRILRSRVPDRACRTSYRTSYRTHLPNALTERVTERVPERTYRTSAAFPRSWIECLSHSMLPMYIHFSMTHLIPRGCRQHWSTAPTSDQLFLRPRVCECIRKHFVILLGFENRGQYLFVTLTESFCHCFEYVHSVLF